MSAVEPGTRAPKRTRRSACWAGVVACSSSVLGCQFLPPGLFPGGSGSSAPVVHEPTHCGDVGDPDPVPVPSDQNLIGAADFHNHQFSNLGFGGHVVWGDAWSPQGIDAALSKCGSTDLCVDDREHALCSAACLVWPNRDECEAACDEYRCPPEPPHGQLGLMDPIGAALGQGVGHRVTGYPDFLGWPNYNTYTHQQVYHRWLRRAFDGGLRLIVMHAVTNEVLCQLLDTDHSQACDDMSNADRQLDAASELEQFIDYQNDCDSEGKGKGNGWYRIARSPQEARQIIQSGAMAVVLGLEVNSIFGCKQGRCKDPTQVQAQVKKYQDKGVRHVFPIHLLDNAFGGTAASNDLFNFASAIENPTHQLMSVWDCSKRPDGHGGTEAGYEFRFGVSSTATALISTLAKKFGLDYPRYPEAGAHCNTRGLEREGRNALRAIMRAKMIIDVDHMSTNARAATFQIAKDCQYHGLISGHSGFTQILHGQENKEGQLTPTEVTELLDQGGVLAPILHQGARSEVSEYPVAGKTTVAADCGDSAKSFAQAYRYAVARASEAAKKKADAERVPADSATPPTNATEPAPFVAVGFGSDINGFASMPAPRFGPYACAGDGAPQKGRVQYPFTPLNGIVESMPQSQAGTRVFDINTDGFAHIGLFPDFVEELRTLGLSDDELAPLFNAAEGYIRLWEAVEADDVSCPDEP